MIISIIIPVCDENGLIEKNLNYLNRTCRRSQVEIILVDGGQIDVNTDPVKSGADKILKSSRKNRAYQMHLGAAASKGDLLLFLHIDTLLPPNWFDSLFETWNNKQQPAATAFRLQFDKTGWPYNLIRWAAEKRSICTGVPHGDQAIAVSRKRYFEIGGYPDVPLLEEYLLFKQFKNIGNVKLLPDNIITSTRRYEKNGPLRTGLRNAALLLLYAIGCPPNSLARFYR